jgi:hypothetical protein
MHEERAVGDAFHVDAWDCAGGGHDPVKVVGVAGDHGDVSDLLAGLDADEIDRA